MLQLGDFIRLSGKVTKITLTKQAAEELMEDIKGLYNPNFPRYEDKQIALISGIEFYVE